MLPVLILGAVTAVGVAGYKLARQCTLCQERLKWTHSCLRCDKVICTGCGTEFDPILRGGNKLQAGGYACLGACTTTMQARGDDLVAKYEAEQERRRKRLERISRVRLVSVNYGGQQKPEYGIRIETGWYSEKSDAEEAARTIAVDSHDVDVVWYVNVTSQKSQGLSPNGRTYYYREWQLVGEV